MADSSLCVCQTVEMCDRRVVEILLNDNNFLSVVGVFEHNPGLIRRIDFRTALEGNQGFKEVCFIAESRRLSLVVVCQVDRSVF